MIKSQPSKCSVSMKSYVGFMMICAVFLVNRVSKGLQDFDMCWIKTGSWNCASSDVEKAKNASSTVKILYPIGLTCDIDVSIFLDASTAVSKEQYAKESSFLREKLSKKWVVSPSWTDVSLAAYGNDGASWFGGFWYHEYELDKYNNDLLNISTIGPLGGPNITMGLIAMSDLLDERRRVAHDVASILFTYTSDEEDLKMAQDYVDSLTYTGDRLIVVGMGSEVDIELIKKYLDVPVIYAEEYDDDLANKIADAICEEEGVVPTLKPHPKLDCDADVVLYMDRSTVLSRKNISDQVTFWHRELADRWTINKFETEFAFGDYSRDAISYSRWGAYLFHYANNEAMEPILRLFERGPPAGYPSISYGLESLSEVFDWGERRPNRTIVSMVFVYTSVAWDVKSAKKYVPKITAGNDRLVIIGVGPKVDMQLLSTLSGEAIHIDKYGTDEGDLLNHAICNKVLPLDFEEPENLRSWLWDTERIR